ncbi:nucleosome assembly protein 1-like 1 isoform X2 [Stegodyphus dumicola]|uniref:nucleosome assembly protein 1-like 1 isoform X2 n=1 Tax=Stegodyphus dumicola TaxID=202533 RepID=UPI0015AD0731|nr:nucleosome assembly protein 1-like 1 isoform X2 [Stegodyphus dumicola]
MLVMKLLTLNLNRILDQAAIITSSIIPTDKDIFQLDSEKEAELSKVKVEGDTEARMDIPEAEIKGIPGFWLTALKNAPLVADFIEEYDEPILKHLKDIKAVTLSNPMSFYLEFQFEPNDYFTNTVLTKSYALKCVPDSKNIFSFKGPEIVTCKGCKIHWKKFKNVTAETKKKKARKAFRTITKYDETASFFNFFNPPPVQENDDQMDDETIKILNNDFDLSIAIKDHLIPNALLFFTGGKVVDDEVNVKAME